MISHTVQAVSRASVFLTCTEGKYQSNQFVVQKNTLIRMLSGEMRIILPERTLVVGAGDTIFYPQLELARVINSQKMGSPINPLQFVLRRSLCSPISPGII